MEYTDLFLRKDIKTPLYQQLYQYYVEAIRAGRLRPGEKLPSKRTAASQLGISVNTVDEAYQMLAAEGYIAAPPRSRFVVQKLEQMVLQPSKVEKQIKVTPKQEWRYSFSTGGVAPELFPRKTWNRLFKEVLANEPDLFEMGEPLGDRVLRDAIADYLRSYRGVKCTAEQVVVGAGLEVLLGFFSRLLLDKTVAVEDPGYPKTIHILQNSGVHMVPIQVDEEGMPPQKLKNSGASVAYLTPSHQFPTGGVMPVGRRTELLQWAAAEPGRLLIEDDYDSEFRFDGRPLPCLQGLDEAGVVVYASTFSRSLSPSLRIAYMVLPEIWMEKWRRVYGDYACTVPRPEQHTLALFMTEGHFARSVNRSRAAYRHRRNMLVQAIEIYLPDCTIQNAHTGLYLVLLVPNVNVACLAQRARKIGIRLHAIEEYRQDKSGEKVMNDALLLGYGGLQEADIEPAVKELSRLIQICK